MKAGIVTWFQYKNYGTVLQAYALQKYINSKNLAECELINYIPKKLWGYRLRVEPIVNKIKRETKIVTDDEKKYESSKNEKFNKFISENIKLSRKIQNKEELKETNNIYDMFICGSDQIWNKYNPFYYLRFVNDNKFKASYAPSFGRSKATDYKSKRKKALERFNLISVREEQGKDIIKDLIGNDKEISIVSDPTLLLEKEEWEKISSSQLINGEYIICYLLGDRKKNKKYCYDIARKLNKPVFFIPVNYNQYSETGYIKDDIVGPSEFLSLLKNASFVCTDSFHGLIFSLLFVKDFVCLKRFEDNDKTSQNSRIYSLSKKLEITDRILDSEEQMNEILKRKLNYEEINNRINNYKSKSKDYIERIFQKYKEK